MTDHLLVEKSGGIARITFNRPEARNAVSVEMRTALIDAMLAVEQDDSIRCVALGGAGKNFMAGGDVKSFSELTKLEPQERRSHFVKRIHTIQPLLIAMQRMNKPIVCVVQGAAVGFGFSLAMACDLVIAASDARFACSYIGIGASPDGSGSYYLPQLVGLKRAMEIAMLGDMIDAPTALAMGLVNRVAAEGDLEAEAEGMIERLANAPTIGLGHIKRLLYASADNSLQAQMSMEAQSFAECAATEDWVEGVTAFTEKRKPQFRGC
ncbi:MAG: enoyl-CoA hydratase [Halioglobus sp.]|nr:enoyl-CoA hydratase [Halioglobus sp.]